MKRYLLLDCNNFFVSCERAFDPSIRNKPVVVLSSNDACVIARSNEVKALGVKMGVPAFECKELFKKHNVVQFSANFTLYGDMSARIMQLISQYSQSLEVYSIDEAFFFITEYTDNVVFNNIYYTEYARFLADKIKQCTGVPVSIGIGPTKTLAKLANHIAKKQPVHKGVFDITPYMNNGIDEVLETVKVEDVWGIGYQYTKKLKAKGMLTAKDFKYAHDYWVRKNMKVIGYKTLLEIRGKPCIALEEIASDKKSITVSRLFGRTITGLWEMKEAVALYVTMAAEKLRKQKQIAYYMTVFIISKRYRDEATYYNASSYTFAVATSYTPELIEAAHECLESIYKQGYEYRKAGVILEHLVSADAMQLDLCTMVDNLEEKKDLMKSIDRANGKYGKNKVRFAAIGTKQQWKMKQLKKSQLYTTSWFELLTIDVR